MSDMMTYGEAVIEEAVSGKSLGLQSLDDFLLDVTTRKERREPTLMDKLVSEALREEGPTRRWFLKAGLTIGAVAALSVFPGRPVHATAVTFFAATTGDNSDGTTWAKAKTTITTGIAVCGANDYLLVDATYAVSATGAVTWTPPAGGLAIISVTPTGASGFSAFTSGAAESVGAASSAFTIAGAAGSGFYLSGLRMNSGTNASSSCLFNIANTASVINYVEAVGCTFDHKPGAIAAFNLGLDSSASTQGAKIRLRDCTFICSGSRAGAFLSMTAATVEIINPTFSITGGTKPVSLFAAKTNISAGRLSIMDADLSGYAVSSSAYFDVTNWNSITCELQNCKLSATPTLTTGTWPGGNGYIQYRNTGSGNTVADFGYINSYGTLTADATVSKDSGFTFAGTAVSWKVVTSSLCSQFRPFVTPTLPIWDTTISPTGQTPTISVAQVNGAANLNDMTCWARLDFAASATTTQYTYQSGRNLQPFVGTPVDWTADGGATWTGAALTGGGTPVKQLINPAGNSGTITAFRAGLVKGQLFFGVASATVWFNTKVDGIT